MEPKLKENQLVRTVKNLFGFHTIYEEELILKGADLRKALSENDLMEFFLTGFNEFHFYYKLYLQEKDLDDFYNIEDVLKRLGFESIEDFEFIDLNDLFCSEFRLELDTLKEISSVLKEPGGMYSLSYDLNRKEVYFDQRKKVKNLVIYFYQDLEIENVIYE